MASSLSASEEESSPWHCNFIVMSEAGKPIFARYGSEEEIGQICGLLRALSARSFASLGSNIRSLRSGKLCMVFMSMGYLHLAAIGNEDAHETYLRLQLEYIVGQILFGLTERVQDYFNFDPGFDLRSVLGATDAGIITGILDESSPVGNPGQYLFGAAETLFPISPAIRSRASNILLAVGLKTEFTAFAILAAGDKLVTVIQPSFPAHQMRVSDLHLLLKVLNRQPGLTSQELWIPVCLPLFSAKDFLFCYTQCFCESSKLCLILVSQQSTIHQFQLFQEAAANIRRALDLPPASESPLLEIVADNKNAMDSSLKDVRWRRSKEDCLSVDEDYVDVSFGDLDVMLPYLPSPTRGNDCVFLREVQAACQPDTRKAHIDHYLATGSVMHFLLRMESPLSGALRRGRPGKLTQCLTSQLGFPFTDESAKNKVWITYQKLRLRLLHGSATLESTLQGLDRTFGEPHFEAKTGTSGIASDLPAILLASASPGTEEKISFVVDRSELYLAMHGPEYEFYAIFPRASSFKTAASSATRLVRRLFADQRSLFLCNPLTWDD